MQQHIKNTCTGWLFIAAILAVWLTSCLIILWPIITAVYRHATK